MEPFGPGNMRPVFITRNITETGFSRVVKEKHLRFCVKQGDVTFTGIGFNLADKAALLQKDQLIDLVYTIDINEWNGMKSLQLKVIDFRPSEKLEKQ
jgi:single-stranded-DNA-specific exonuclease